MNKVRKISTFQMFSVLFLSRIISLFTFMLPSSLYLPSGDKIITAIPVMLIEFFYAAVFLYTFNMNKNRSVIETAKEHSSAFAKLLSIIYTLAFIWFAGIGTARFELFISTVMFPNSELTLMIVILLAACLYASLKGFEAIGRASAILFAVLGLSIIFVLLTVTGEFEYHNLKPFFTEGISPIAGFAFYASVRAAELLSLNVSAPMIRGNVKKMTFLWIISFAVVCTVILTFLSGVTGEYGEDQIFPLYTLTVIAKFGIFERLDDILTGIWVLCSFIQVAYLLALCLLGLKQGFGKAKKIPVAFLCTAGVFTVYALTSQTVTVFSETVSSKLFDLAFIILMIVIPVTVTLTEIIKNKRRTQI